MFADTAAGAGHLLAWYEIAGIIIAVPASAAIVWGVFKVVRHLAIVHEVIIGRPKTRFSDGIPSMVERFDEVNLELGKLTYTLTVNGNVSAPPTMLDRVQNLEAGQRTITRQLNAQDEASAK
jgi:hypothetical protein